jgi:hypothetical protein
LTTFSKMKKLSWLFRNPKTCSFGQSSKILLIRIFKLASKTYISIVNPPCEVWEFEGKALFKLRMRFKDIFRREGLQEIKQPGLSS